MSSTTSASTTLHPTVPEARPESASPRPKNELCPVQESIKIIGRKWHLIILWELSKHPHGFNELKGATQGISAKMLSQSLSDLEDHDLVLRDVLSERPLRVSYRLTEKAYELTGVFEVLHDWGQRHGLIGPPQIIS